MPLNQGCLEPVTISLAPGSLLNPSREAAVAAGRLPAQPFVLVAQQDVADPSRVGGDGHRTLWSYTHVPNGSDVDCTEVIEAPAMTVAAES